MPVAWLPCACNKDWGYYMYAAQRVANICEGLPKDTFAAESYSVPGSGLRFFIRSLTKGEGGR